MHDIFVSYSRKDKSFVQQLVRALEKSGRNIWVDFDDIPFASDWWEEICAGIAASQIVVFVITPDSIGSEVCGLEIKQVLKNNKRLVPIVYRDIPPKDVPHELSHLNWIMFKDVDDFDSSLKILLETLDTDLDKLRQHTRLLTRALEWEQMRFSPSLLLRGDELAEMQKMADEPSLTALQREFLEKSKQVSERQQILKPLLSGVLGGLLAIGFWAFTAFRSDILITPLRLIYTFALGPWFGINIGFIGIVSNASLWKIVTNELPLRARPVFKSKLQLFIRILLCLIFGVLAWASYIWFLEDLDLSTPGINALLFGGVGLAVGVGIRNLFNLPGWLAALLTAVLTWLPIYLTFQDAFSSGITFLPLIFFYDDPNQVFSVAIPMAIIIALGANAESLLAETRHIYLKFKPHKVEAAKA